MPVSIDIAVEDERWECLDFLGLCDVAIKASCSILENDVKGELSIAFVNDARIQELNRDYREKDKPTNVLSFPMDGALLGDIVLAFETIAGEAKEQGKIFEHHLTHLIVHGFLHVLGYDHLDDKSAAEMEAIEITTLAQLGIDNPYELKDFQDENKE